METQTVEKSAQLKYYKCTNFKIHRDPVSGNDIRLTNDRASCVKKATNSVNNDKLDNIEFYLHGELVASLKGIKSWEINELDPKSLKVCPRCDFELIL